MAVAALALVLPSAAAPAGASADVLILDTSVSGGASSFEAEQAEAQGLTVEVVGADGWKAKTTADFAGYRAIILGDPNCSDNAASVAAAEETAATWGPAVTGNVIVIGSDPTIHHVLPPAKGGKLVAKGIAFAGAESGKTGAYITLSCYYHDAPADTPAPLLDAFEPSGFTVHGIDCLDDIHLVATDPVLAALTDDDLSNWSCSVHEAFDSWPDDFLVLAMARDDSGTYIGPDGTLGTPYILVRGDSVEVVSDVHLTPKSVGPPVGSTQKLTAAIDAVGAGISVTFTVLDGPDAGAISSIVTGGDGKAAFSLAGAHAGTDLVRATYVDSLGRTHRSNDAKVSWVVPSSTSPADLELLATAPAAVRVGDSISYRLTVTNRGPGGAWEVAVTDVLPSGVSFVSASSTAGSCSGTQIVVCPLGGLGLGGGAVITIVVRADSAGTVSNKATVSSAAVPDSNAANNLATSVTEVTVSCTLRTTTAKVLAARVTRVGVLVRRGGVPARGVRVAVTGPGRDASAVTGPGGLAVLGVRAPRPGARFAFSAEGCPTVRVTTGPVGQVRAFLPDGSAVRPSSANCSGISFSQLAGIVPVRVRVAGKPVVNAVVVLRGPGIAVVATSGRDGIARLRARPEEGDVLHLSVPNVAPCVKRYSVRP